MSKEPKNLEQRDGFQSKWGFILACIGSAVGMGNIWRFPIMVQKYGGMTFLLPYFIFVILIGSTGVIEEFALGRRALQVRLVRSDVYQGAHRQREIR